MKKYNDLLIRQTDSLNGTDGSDNVQPATKVWIVAAGTRNLASLYDGEDINTANQIANPLTTDSYGRMSFYIEDGDYDFYINFNTDIEFKVKSSEPIYDVKGSTVGFNHSTATNRSAVGAHDDIYTRRKSLAEASSEDAPIGTSYRISDLGEQIFEVVALSDVGGMYIPYNAQKKLKRVINNNTVMYIGTGTAQDTARINEILANLPPRTDVILRGEIVIDDQLIIAKDNFKITLDGTITAANNSDFEYMVLGTSRSNVLFVGGVLDANSLSRRTGKTVRRMGGGFITSTNCGFQGVLAKNVEGHGGIPGVGLVCAGGSLRCYVRDCLLQDCGDPNDPNMAADGVFTSGTQNIIDNIVGSNITDTLAVIESSSYSIMSNITGYTCSAVAAITNASVNTSRGNQMSNITGINWSASNTGGIQIGVPNSATGNLIDTTVSNVSLYAETGIGYGVGSAINIRTLGAGKAIGVVLDNIKIRGSQNKGILADGEDIIIDAALINDCAESCIQYQAGSTGEVTDSTLTGGQYGLLANTSAQVISKTNHIKGQSVSGLGALGTSVIDSVMDVNRAATKFTKDVGATVNILGYDGGSLSTSNYAAVASGAEVASFPVYNSTGGLVGYVPVKAIS